MSKELKRKSVLLVKVLKHQHFHEYAKKLISDLLENFSKKYERKKYHH